MQVHHNEKINKIYYEICLQHYDKAIHWLMKKMVNY